MLQLVKIESATISFGIITSVFWNVLILVLLQVIFSTYPVFQWVTDYCPDCEYGIRVCEFTPDQHSSLSEALDDVSNIPLSQSEDFYSIGNINSFQYPTSGVIDLQPSKYYVWQIRRSYKTTIDPHYDYSPIYIFQIRSPSVKQLEFTDPYLSVIQSLIGKKQFNYWFFWYCNCYSISILIK